MQRSCSSIGNVGRDLVQKKAEERWGAGVVEQVSLDLQREFPNADGFSTRLRYRPLQIIMPMAGGEVGA